VPDTKLSSYCSNTRGRFYCVI